MSVKETVKEAAKETVKKAAKKTKPNVNIDTSRIVKDQQSSAHKDIVEYKIMTEDGLAVEYVFYTHKEDNISLEQMAFHAFVKADDKVIQSNIKARKLRG